jgi:ABC-2 type transport system permease protein
VKRTPATVSVPLTPDWKKCFLQKSTRLPDLLHPFYPFPIMFNTFFSFELRSWLRSPMPWIFLFIIAALAFGGTISDQLQIGGSFGNVWKNAPFVAQNWYAVFSLLSILLTTAFLNTAAIRDFERQTSQIIFSKPVSKSAYYFGHFWGALLVALLPMLGVSMGMWIGVAGNSMFGWLEAQRFGPFEIQGHVMGFLTFALPNAIFVGGILYAIAINTRSTLYAFVAATALLVGYGVASSMMRNIDNETIVALVDPFGFSAFSIATKYWTVEDKNTLSAGLSGMLLLNRLLWMSVGILCLLLGYRRFDFSEKKADGKKTKFETAPDKVSFPRTDALPRVTPGKGLGTQMGQFFSQFKTEWLWMVRSVAFLLLTLLGLLNCLPNLLSANESYGTHELPVTYTMINYIRGAFYLFTIIMMAYFSGALVWKERNSRINEIVDALPTRNWTAFLGKFAALLGVMATLQVVIMAAAVLAQALLGYTRFEIGIYVRELLLVDLLGFGFTLALAFLVQALSPNMYLGFFITIIVIIVNTFIWSVLRINTNMLDFGGTPAYTLSDFYGYEPFSQGLMWYHAYWGLFSALLGLLAVLFWPRGKESGWRARLQLARREWPGYRVPGLLLLTAWLGTAGWTYYNTEILNRTASNHVQEQRQLNYEKKYKQYSNRLQPRVYDAKYDITLHPQQRAVLVNGRFMARNIYRQAIDTLWVNTPQYGRFSLRNERLQPLLDDSLLHWRMYRFDPALQPGDSILLEFSTAFQPKGFEDEVTWSRVVQNGTFFDNTDVIPIFGYQESNEVSSKNRRRELKLPEKSRRPALNRQDTLHRLDAYIGINSDWVAVETVIRTDPDQIAIAPGSLLREWQENGRRCFQYRLDHASFNFYSFMSARYEVARREWNGIQLEVYYHKDHGYNVQRMLHAMQKSLEYYTTHFGPYYHKQCRIIEFPRFAEFAQAFPGTMPYSEGIGFIQDFKDSDDIDMVFYVAAHEIGHQYWGHQECGANMQGSEMLVETFAQWSALMLMEHEYGRDQMRKFLQYEMDRYLRGRGRESEKELPLARCEGQGYIHYNKGSVAMYYLKEMIGEDMVNASLREFLGQYRYAPPPYPVSLDALDAFYKYTPDSLDYVVKDLFEDITLFENRCKSMEVKDLPDGKFEVSIDIECRKLKADDLGKETEVPVNDYIEIGAFARPDSGKKFGKTLYRQRVKITQKDNHFVFQTDARPDKAGVDPFSLLIDRNPEDNMK